MNFANITREDWKELGLQCLMGGVYGAAGAFLATDTLGTRLMIIVAVAAGKGLAHTLIRLLKPKLVAQGRAFRTYHWTERIERWL